MEKNINLQSFSRALKKDFSLKKTLKEKTLFLDEVYQNINDQQRMFHLKHPLLIYCDFCSLPAQWKPYNKGYYAHCGSEQCISSFNKRKIAKQWKNISDDSKEKRKQKWKESIKKSNIEKWGVEWHSQTEDWSEKVKHTSKEKFGTEYYSQTKECKNRVKKTCLKKYGVDNMLKSSLAKEGMIRKYGVENYTQSTEFNIRTHPFGSSWKIFKFPSGKEVKIQGYEDKVLHDLLSKYDENDIIVKNSEIEKFIGKIWYYHDNKKHRYFPDIFIISENMIVEVKSHWTFSRHKDLNLLKEKACKDIGLNFQFVIL